VQRERRRSFYDDSGVPPSYTSSYARSQSPTSVAGDLDRRFNDLDLDRERRSSVYTSTTRTRKHSISGGERTYGPPGAAVGYAASGGYPAPGSTSPYRQSTYSTSPNPRPHDFSAYPGGPDPIARAASPYGRPPTEPIARATSPYGRPLTEPIARAPSAYGNRAPSEPIPRAASPYHSAYVPRAPSPIPPRAPSPYSANHSSYIPRGPSPIPPHAPSYGKPPLRPASPYSRAPSPYASSQVYPPGHVLEGQRSRAPSPMPGPPSAFPTSPRMPVSLGGEQLTAPEAFARPANAAQPYTPFATMRIQNMDQFYDQIPRMPLVLDTHDVYHQDWIRFMSVRPVSLLLFFTFN